jgi:S-DNA-T family DNA segregation ATPase FtsK/SpoIIIE
MKKLKVKSIADTNKLRYKFVVIDEYADLKSRSDIDNNIKILAQKGRACGIHLIIATQRASTKVIDGDVKMNFPVKVVFRMGKEVDSRVMIDEPGAEKLLGKGDCLFAGDWGIERLQAFNTK